MPRFNLPDITFTEKSPEQVEAEVLAEFQKQSGLSLAPADPRRKFIQSIAYLLSLQRSLIDYRAKQNLLSYAQDNYLDHLGSLLNTSRLGPLSATTTIRFHFSISQERIIPAGTRVTAGDNVFFATQQAVVVTAEQSQVDIEAICTEPGSHGNGYLPGQIAQLVDPLPWVQSVENITTSEGGSDIEDDDAYAERIHQAPESFSVAGPEGAYHYWAMTASPLIIDVSVRSPSPGEVEVRPLLKGGEIPGQELLDLVSSVLSDKTRRPLTDLVQVLAPEVVGYNIELTYWIGTNNTSVSNVQSRVHAAVNDYISWQKSKLGRDIDPSELIALVKNAGAKRVTVTLPAYQELEPYEVAIEDTITVNYGGLEND